METAITNATDTPALETLYTYTTDDDGNLLDHLANFQHWRVNANK